MWPSIWLAVDGHRAEHYGNERDGGVNWRFSVAQAQRYFMSYWETPHIPA